MSCIEQDETLKKLSLKKIRVLPLIHCIKGSGQSSYHSSPGSFLRVKFLF